MKTLVAFLFAFCLVPQTASLADIILTTGSHDSFDLDFDGAGTETNGDLGFFSKSFTLNAADLAGDPAFANILSVTLHFTSFGGTLSADNSGGPIAGGIGVARQGEGGNESRSLTEESDEQIGVAVTSVSSDPNQKVRLSELRFASWRNAFPVSQVEFFNATVDGNPFLTGESGTSIAVFDFPTSNVIFESVSTFAGGGGDSVRLHHIGLTVANVPEPTGLLLCGTLAVAALIRRR